MKKLKSSMFACFAAMTMMALAGCGHEHTFAETWAHDGAEHWHAATCEHTEEKMDVAQHDRKGTPSKEDVAPTCEAEGIDYLACSVCGYEWEEKIPVDTCYHSYEANWSTNGASHWHAAACGHKEMTKDMAAHDANGKPTHADVPATHLKAGTHYMACSVCAYEWSEEIPLSTEHTYATAWSTNATDHWHASTCGHPDMKGSLGGHDRLGTPTQADVEATCNAKGRRYFACSVCKYEWFEDTPIDPSAHDYQNSWTTNEESHWHKAKCAHSGVVSGFGNHDDLGTPIHDDIESTTTVKGKEYHACSVCGYEWYVELPLTAKDATTITVNTTSKPYDAQPATFPITKTEGSANATVTWYEGASLTALSSAPKNAGSYRVHVSIPENDTHLGVEKDYLYTISKCNLDPVAGFSFETKYDGTNIAQLGASYFSGIPSGSNFGYVVVHFNGSDYGSTFDHAEIRTLSSGDNFTFSAAAETKLRALTINETRELELGLDFWGEENPALSGIVDDSIIESGYLLSADQGKVGYNVSFDDDGEAQITLTGEKAGNYSVASTSWVRHDHNEKLIVDREPQSHFIEGAGHKVCSICGITTEESVSLGLFSLKIEDRFNLADGVTVTGAVNGAKLVVGDEVSVFHNGSYYDYTIREIKIFSQLKEEALPGDSVGIRFDGTPDFANFLRGDMIFKKSERPVLTDMMYATWTTLRATSITQPLSGATLDGLFGSPSFAIQTPEDLEDGTLLPNQPVENVLVKIADYAIPYIPGYTYTLRLSGVEAASILFTSDATVVNNDMDLLPPAAEGYTWLFGYQTRLTKDLMRNFAFKMTAGAYSHLAIVVWNSDGAVDKNIITVKDSHSAVQTDVANTGDSDLVFLATYGEMYRVAIAPDHDYGDVMIGVAAVNYVATPEEIA